MANAYTDRKLSARYPTDLAAWKGLAQHYREDMRERTLRQLFARDGKRVDRYSLTANDLTLDYSKTHVNSRTRKLLAQLARQAGVAAAIEAMFAGERINKTEGRSVLHVALRAKISDTVALETPGVPEVWEVLTRIESFVEGVQSGAIKGSTGKRLTDIVNIGIGGSDLGPVMASRALRPYWKDGMRFHSVSNVDGTQLSDLKAELDPETTLFVICSKTFTTQETMANAQAARAWVIDKLDELAVQYHFVAASTNHEAMDEFGIRSDYRFGFWDWVGGRYSLWSAIGLPLAIAVGFEHFTAFLDGAHAMDEHFRTAPPERNLPMLMGMIGIWHRNVWDYPTHAILPYDQRLSRFAAHFQQVDMESNGKRVTRDGAPVDWATGPVIWGEPGTNGQHAFYQLLHQGTTVVPADLIGFIEPAADLDGQHDMLVGNLLAQAEALAFGKTASEVAASGVPAEQVPHRTFPGNRPSSVILAPSLTPAVLGQLVALYEHKVFTQGAIWGINSFDQWGVELGKALATTIIDELTSATPPDLTHDESTNALIRRYRQARHRP